MSQGNKDLETLLLDMTDSGVIINIERTNAIVNIPIDPKQRKIKAILERPNGPNYPSILIGPTNSKFKLGCVWQDSIINSSGFEIERMGKADHEAVTLYISNRARYKIFYNISPALNQDNSVEFPLSHLY
jgi:hypothetical protein